MERALMLAWTTMVHISDGFFASLPNIVIGAVALALFVLLARLVRKIVVKLSRRARMDETLCHVLGTLTTVTVNMLGILIVATIVFPSFSPGQLVAGLGVTSVAVGFAFKDILENFFAGILLLWQKPFRIGDEIRTNGFEGEVEDIDIRSTRIKTADGELVVVPNGNMLSSPIVVLTGYERRRVKMTLPSMSGNSAPDERRQTVLSILKNLKSVAQEPQPVVLQTSLDGALDLYFWTNSKQSSLQQAINEVAMAIDQAVHTKPVTTEAGLESQSKVERKVA